MIKQRWPVVVVIAAVILAANAATAASLDRAVLDEINYARMHPGEYAMDLREMRRGDEGYAETDPNAIEEAIEFLQRQRPLPPLSPSRALALAAAEQTAAQGPRGLTGHTGAGGSSPSQRMQHQGVWCSMSAEAISYGYGAADSVVRQLIIDQGVANRGHRMTIFDPAFRIAGVGCGPHARYRHMCVIDFASAPVVR